jgi:hypothetical protein
MLHGALYVAMNIADKYWNVLFFIAVLMVLT